MRRALIASALLLCGAHARAADTALEIAPTSLELKPGEAGLLYVANRGNAAVTAQIETFDWHQNNGGDVLSPSDSLFVSPPLAPIAPGERQTIRVLAQPNTSSESDYRLVISELPQPQTPEGGQVRVLLQFSVPVFAGAQNQSTPNLVWDARREGTVTLVSARNDGPACVNLTALTVSQNGKPLALPMTHLGYVLPGAVQIWQVAALAGPLHISAKDARTGAAIEADVAPHS